MKTEHLLLAVAAVAVLSARPSPGAVQNMEQYWFGLGVEYSISAGVNTMFDAYNCGPGDRLTIRTNSTTARAVSIQKGIIDGDIVVGAGGNPATVVNAPPATGAVYAASEPFIHPSVTVPADLAGSASKGSITGTTTISESGRYDSILSGASLTIDAPVTLYVTGDMSLGGILITPNGSLTLYAGGNITGGNGLLFNTLGQDTKKLQILGLDTCVGIDWISNGQFYGTIYAPAAELSMKNSNSIYGALVCDSLIMSNSNSFHYDASLPEPATLLLLGLGGLVLRGRHRAKQV